MGAKASTPFNFITEVKDIMEVIKLLHSIKINGKERKEFEYDTELLTAEQFIGCSTRAGLISNRVMELNAALHEQLGQMAIMNIDRDIDSADLGRLTGRDIVSIAKIGRSMFMPEECIELDMKNSTLTMKHGIDKKKKFKFDLESITVDQFDLSYGKGGFASQKTMELNEAFHLYLGAYAIANAEERKVEDIIGGLKGKDVVLVATLGRNFFTPTAEDTETTESTSQQSKSEEQSDPTQESITAELENSNEDQSANF